MKLFFFRRKKSFAIYAVFVIYAFYLILLEIQLPNALNRFDLTQDLLPNEIYTQIICRRSIDVVVNTTLCIHDPKKLDRAISYRIWKDGIWERQILGPFMRILQEYPDILVFDLGANIGEYTLFAAKHGNDVISVEVG